MKGAFSRLVRAGGPERFTKVLLQQGRVLLDADWNDLVEILERELRERTRLIIGDAGGPIDDAGFALRFACGIRLNSGGETDGQYGQWIEVRSKTLPLAGAYTIALQFRLPPASGDASSRTPLLIDVDARWSVTVRSDNCLELRVAGREQPIALGTVEADRSWLLVASYRPKSDVDPGGLDVWSYPADDTPKNPAADDVALRERRVGEQAIRIGGGPDEREELNCTIEGLYVWAQRSAELPRDEDGRLVLHDCELRCDLDTSTVERLRRRPQARAKIVDRSTHHNDGTIFTLPDRELPPVVLLSAFAGPGVYFVDGTLAQSRATTPVEVRAAPDAKHELFAEFYLEVRQRFITALQDERLLEPALNGPDTTARTETVWRVGTLEATSEALLDARWAALETRLRERGEARFTRTLGNFDAGNRLYRVEIQHPGWAWTAQLSDALASKATVNNIDSVFVEDPSIAAMLERDSPVALWAGTGDAPSVARVVGQSGASFQLDGLPADHQNLRLLPLASFKWSRDNGSVAFPVASIVEVEGDDPRWTISLAGPGYNGLDLDIGQWLELVDDATELDGRGGWFFRIVGLDLSAVLTVTVIYVGAGELPLAPAEPGTNPEVALGPNPIVRRWDVGVDAQPDNGLPTPLRIVRDGVAAPLEQGIEVVLSGPGLFAAGDWWVAPVRDAVERGLLESAQRKQPPQGIDTQIARLARLSLGLGFARHVDQRELFSPLTRLSAEPVQPTTPTTPDVEVVRERESVSVETQTWIASARILVGDDDAPAGFVATGEVVTTRVDVSRESWSFVAHGETDPRGPGDAVLWDGRPVFLANKAAHVHTDGSWRTLPQLPSAVVDSTDYSAASFGSLLWVFATGSQSSSPTLHWLHAGATAWQLADKLTDALSQTPELGAASAGVASLGASLHVVGGWRPPPPGGGSGYLANHFEIDPRTGTITRHGELRRARADFALVAHAGQLYAVGGRDDTGYLASVERWHPEIDQWIELDAKDRPPGMSAIAAASVPDGIVVTGGYREDTRTASAEVWLFDTGSSSWRKLDGTLSTPRSKHGLVALPHELRAIAGEGSPGSDHLALTRTLRVMQFEPQTPEQ